MTKMRVQDSTIRLIRYEISSKTDGDDADDAVVVTMDAVTEEEAQDIATMLNGDIEKLDVSGVEWIDGIKMTETNMPMEEANRILAMGEEGYKKWLEQQAAQSPENLAAENAQLKQQLTDTQLALVEVYEMMIPS